MRRNIPAQPGRSSKIARRAEMRSSTGTPIASRFSWMSFSARVGGDGQSAEARGEDTAD